MSTKEQLNRSGLDREVLEQEKMEISKFNINNIITTLLTKVKLLALVIENSICKFVLVYITK